MDAHTLATLFNSSPIDWIAIGLLLSLFALDAFRVGASRSISFALAAPLSLFVYEEVIPRAAYVGKLANDVPSTLQSLYFTGILVVVFLLIAVMTRAQFGSSTSALQAFLASVAAVVVALTVWQQVPSLTTLWPFSPFIRGFFGSAYELYWILGSYLVLLYTQL